MPFSHRDSNSSASPSTFSDTSFCLSTACTDSALTDSNHFSAKPNRPSCEPYRSPRNLQEFDKSIYSFTWSLSYSQHLEVDAAIESYSMTDSQQLQDNNPKPFQARSEKRFQIPNLPQPIFWSTVANPDVFADYIEAKQLMPHDRTVPPPVKPIASSAKSAPSSAKLAPNPAQTTSATPSSAKHASVKLVKPAINTHYISEAVGKPLTNMRTIVQANTDDRMVRRHMRSTDSWILDHFRNAVLPAPFHSERLTDPDPNNDPGATKLWLKSQVNRLEDNFVDLPDISSEGETIEWLMHYARNIGKLSLKVNKLYC